MNHRSEDHRQSTDSGTLERHDQLAWEAPALRPVFTPENGHEQWAHPCPAWCTGEGYQHQPGGILAKNRQHEGPTLRIKQDGARGYVDFDDDGVAGVMASHLAVRLVAGSRELTPRVAISAVYGNGEGERRAFNVTALYPDEVRELIAVLKHLLKVGLETSS